MCLGGLSLPRKSVVRLTGRHDMTLDVYCGRKKTIEQQHCPHSVFDIGQCTVIHYDAGGVSWLTNEKQRKTDIRLSDQ